MADKDLTIGIKTTGDTSGAVAVEKSIFEIEDAAKKAEREMDVLEAKRRKLTDKPEVPEKKAVNLSKPIEDSTVTAAKLGSRINGVAAIIATLGAISTAVFGKLNREMEDATAAGSKFEQQNVNTASAIQLLGDPAGTVKSGWDIIGNAVLGWIDKIVLGDSIAKVKIEANTASVAREKKASFEKIEADHAAMNQKILAADLKLQEAQNNLARSREQRGGVTADQSSANEIARIVKKHASETQIVIAAIAEAQRVQKAALVELKNVDISEDAKDVARKVYADSKVEIQDLKVQLGLKMQTDALSLQDSVEDAQAKAKSGLESKLTANAEALQQELQSIITEKGSAAQAGTQMALDTVNGLLAKGQVTLEDATKLDGAARQFYQSADANATGLRATAQKLLDSDKQALDAYKALNEQITTNSALQQTQASDVAKVVGESQAAITENISIAATKSNEVKTAINGERTNTVQAIQQLAPTPQDTQAIAAAVKEAAKAIAAQGNATISALGALTTTVGQLTARVQKQQQQINQIFSRVR